MLSCGNPGSCFLWGKEPRQDLGRGHRGRRPCRRGDSVAPEDRACPHIPVHRHQQRALSGGPLRLGFLLDREAAHHVILSRPGRSRPGRSRPAPASHKMEMKQ